MGNSVHQPVRDDASLAHIIVSRSTLVVRVDRLPIPLHGFAEALSTIGDIAITQMILCYIMNGFA